MWLISVSAAGRRINDAPHSGSTRLIQHRQSSRYTGLIGIQRVLDAARNGCQGRLMKHTVDALDRFGHDTRIRHIAFEHLDLVGAGLDVVKKPGAEIVQDAYAITAFDQRLGNV